MITEPDVVLTDWGLAVVAGALAWCLRQHARSESVRNGFIIFFTAVAAAGLLGGAVHGFFLDGGSLGARILWPATLLAVGAAALAAWAIGAALAFTPATARAVTVAAACGFIAYAVLILFVTQAFVLAIVGYLPAMLFLGGALIQVYRRTGARPVLAALVGLGVMLGGSWVQWRGIGLHPVYLSHNALYHVIEVFGLLLLFRGARWLAAAPADRGETLC